AINTRGYWDIPEGIYLAATPDGNTLYAGGDGKVLKVNLTNRAVSLFLTGFGRIEYIEVDKNGNVYVVEKGTIKKYNSSGTSAGTYNITDVRSLVINKNASNAYVLTGFANANKKLIKLDANFNTLFTLDMPINDNRSMDYNDYFPSTDANGKSYSVGLALDESNASEPVIWLYAGGYRTEGVIWRITDKGSSFENQLDVIRSKKTDPGLGQPWENLAVDMKTEEVYNKFRVYDGRTGEYKRLFPPWPWIYSLTATDTIYYTGSKVVVYGSKTDLSGDVKVDGHRGYVYLTQLYSSDTRRYGIDGNPAPFPGGSEQMDNLWNGDNDPHGWFVDEKSGNIYALAYENKYRQRYDTNYIQVSIFSGQTGKFMSSPLAMECLALGLGMDREGNYFIGTQPRPKEYTVIPELESQLVPQGTAYSNPYRIEQATIMKFSSGGKLYADAGGPFTVGSTDYSATGLEAHYFGMSNLPARERSCDCANANLVVDSWDRVWAVDAFNCRVQILDKNLNLISTVGEYGNSEDHGNGSFIPLNWPYEVAVSREAAYIADPMSMRVTRLKLAHKKLGHAYVNGATYKREKISAPIIRNGIISCPNPLSKGAKIHFKLNKNQHYTLALFDIKGSLIQLVKKGIAAGGKEYVRFNQSKEIPQGFYLMRLKSNNGSFTSGVIVK
ncbi:MAG: T9SS type A sorting domain-containing protein, partial [bacterium]